MNMLATLNQGIVPQAETAANVLAAQAKAQVEARYMMAMHRPRNWDAVRQDLLKECRRPSFAVNIPEEPDSELLHPVPSQKIGKQLVYRLKKEALQAFPTVGQCIADSITFEEWQGSKEDHEKYLQENKNWWLETTFLGEG